MGQLPATTAAPLPAWREIVTARRTAPALPTPGLNWLLTNDAQCSTPIFIIGTSAVIQAKLGPGNGLFKAGGNDLIAPNEMN